MNEGNLFYYNRKIGIADFEEYTGATLTPGYNPVRMEVKHMRLKMTLNIGVVVPNNQQPGDAYAFILLNNIYVEGRGSLKYGKEVEQKFLKDMRAFMPMLPPFAYCPDGESQQTLSGYNPDNNYEASYAVYSSASFASEHETVVDGIHLLEKVPVVLSTSKLLAMYRLDTVGEPVKCFYDDGVYRLKGTVDEDFVRNQLHNYRNEPTGSHPFNRHFLLDNGNRLWEKQAKLTVVETADAELNGRGFALGSHFYEPVDMLREYPAANNCLFYHKHVYRRSPHLNVLTEEVGEPVPFMDTLIPAALGVLANGAYATVELAGVRTVVVPVVNLYGEPQADLITIEGRLYAVIGPVSDVGFIADDHVFYNRTDQLRVGLRPSNRTVFFCDTPSALDFTNFAEEINRESIPYETPVIHDETFRNRKTAWAVGDTVTITTELTEKSRLVGVSGIIEEVWPNRGGARVSFFEHFEEEIPFENLTRANKTPALITLSV